MELRDPPGEPLSIPFDSHAMPGYFVRAAGAGEGEARPVVICTNGYDATMADMYLATAIDTSLRGYHRVLFDGPGQGSMLVLDGVALAPDWERVVTPVVDAVLARDDVDADRVVLEGWSLGGYLAARAATGDHRLAACVLDPPSWSVFDGVPQLAQCLGIAEAAAALPEISAADEARMMAGIEANAGLRWKTHVQHPSFYDPTVVSEAPLEQTEAGLVPTAEGWFVLNAREARWRHRDGRGERVPFEGETEFPQLGVSLYVLAPGDQMAMYHWEADQEDFFVLSGEALLIIEGEERPLRQWDLVHCPAETKHTIVGAGDARCVVLAVGAREHPGGPGWGGYTVDEAALRHGAGVEQETNDVDEAYARFPEHELTRYRDGWLPGLEARIRRDKAQRRLADDTEAR